MKKNAVMMIMIMVTGVLTLGFSESFSQEQQPVLMCDDKPVTITGDSGRVNGSNGDDVILAEQGAKTVIARSGNDVICILETNVRAVAGQGDDVIISSSLGGNVLEGGPGDDTCFVHENDIVKGCENVIRLLTSPEDEMSEETPREFLIGLRVLTDEKTGQPIVNNTALIGEVILLTAEVTNQQLLDRTLFVTVELTDDQGEVIYRNGETTVVPANGRAIAGAPIQPEKLGTLTLTTTIDEITIRGDDEIRNQVIKETTTLTIVERTRPTPTDTFQVTNPIVGQGSQNTPVTTAEINGELAILVDVNNGFDSQQQFVWEVTITTGANTEILTREDSIGPLVNSQALATFWTPIKTGTANITINIFDNLTDRNTLAPAVTTSITITGDDDFTTRELEARITALEALIAQLQTEIEALKQARG